MNLTPFSPIFVYFVLFKTENGGLCTADSSIFSISFIKSSSDNSAQDGDI